MMQVIANAHKSVPPDTGKQMLYLKWDLWRSLVRKFHSSCMLYLKWDHWTFDTIQGSLTLMHCCIAQRFRSIIIVFRLILELDSQWSCEYSTDRSCNRSDILPQIGCYSPGSLSLRTDASECSNTNLWIINCQFARITFAHVRCRSYFFYIELFNRNVMSNHDVVRYRSSRDV